jgi:hypothetical protein
MAASALALPRCHRFGQNEHSTGQPTSIDLLRLPGALRRQHRSFLQSKIHDAAAADNGQAGSGFGALKDPGRPFEIREIASIRVRVRSHTAPVAPAAIRRVRNQTAAKFDQNKRKDRRDNRE